MGRYRTSSTGGGIRFGFPIAEKESLTFGAGFDKTTVETFDSPNRYIDFVNANSAIPIFRP